MKTSIQSNAWMEPLYIALAILGLTATNVQLLAYLDYGFINGNLNFWKDTPATPASTFILVDLFVFAAAMLTWMFGECRRIGLSSGVAWLYFLGSVFVGICVFMPLFMAHRNRRIRATRPDQQAAPAGGEFVAVALVLLAAALVAYYSFTHVPS